MVRVLGPSKDAEKIKPTATERALGNRVVREGIVRATAPHLLPTLARVNRAFYEDTHLPAVWARQYAPAQVDWPSRTISSALPARLTGPDAFAYALEHRPAKDFCRPLGRCAGEAWHLSLGHGELHAIFGPHAAQILDEVVQILSLRHVGWFPEDETAEESEVRLLKENRLRAYALLRSRLHRLQHNLSVPVYSSKGRLLLLIGLSIAGSWAWGQLASRAAMAALTATKVTPNTAPVERVLVSVANAVLLYSAFLYLGVFLGSDPAVRNALLGPFDYARLNRCAHEIATLEVAARPAVSADELLGLS